MDNIEVRILGLADKSKAKLNQEVIIKSQE